ncbi:MAG: formylmethanofuran dehydrogenase subunit E family protein [candidate division KSB1 bacterium]|nr:formylmethanofuran dehydrogenase subunit E family protein [candidate division KSB1 bacterium]
MKQGAKHPTLMAFGLLIIWFLCTNIATLMPQEKNADTIDWFYPEWAASAPYNTPIVVRDTESALGRYTLKTKRISLRDLVLFHGHLCDGLVIAFVEIKAVLEKLFPDGVVDRTDLRAVSKNGPCWVDAVSMMTGARINFQTLRIDATVDDGFIIQRISTGEAYEVHLKPGVFPEMQASLEARIRQRRAEGKVVSAAEIDQYEAMANELSRKMLTTPAEQLLTITPKPDYKFRFNDLYGSRGDIINKEMPRY